MRVTRPLIPVAPRSHKMPTYFKRKRRPSPLFNDRGFPNPQNSYESMLPEVSAGRLIRKRKHPSPSINSVDPNVGEEFDHNVHGK